MANNTVYLIVVGLLSIALLLFAFFTADESLKSIIIGALIGYLFREGTVVAHDKIVGGKD